MAATRNGDPSQAADQEAVLRRLSEIAGAKNDSALARALEVPPQNVSAWRARGTVPYEVVATFAARRGVSLDYILLGRGSALWLGGEVDPTIAEAIAGELERAAEEAKKQGVTLFPSWWLFGYRLALIYNRVIKRIQPDGKVGDAIAEEVRFLRDLVMRDAAGGSPPKLHPEELRHMDKLGISARDVLGADASKMDLRQEVSVTVNGVKHTGQYVITGTRRLGLTVYYDGRLHRDSHTYRPDQRKHLESVARGLLWEIVTGKKMPGKKHVVRGPAKRRAGTKRY